MSKTKCITHPPRQSIIIIREDYLAICDGSHCAAAILNIFEYWTDNKLDNREQAAVENEIAAAGNAPLVSDELWIFKSIPDLKTEMLGLFGDTKISTALDMLKAKGLLESRHNPKYGWDRTLQYQFNIKLAQTLISRLGTSRKNKASKGTKLTDGSLRNKAAIPKTTQKTTKENSGESLPSVSKKRSIVQFPANIWTWQQIHVDTFYQEHITDLDTLSVSWDKMFKHFNEMPLFDERAGIETYNELCRQGIPPTEYALIISHTRKVRSWQDVIRINDVMKEISSFKAKTRRSNIINLDPAMDLSKPIDITPILMRKTEEAS